MKQIIIVRKDLNMSKGKMAAQVAHASMAFLTSQIRKNSREVLDCNIGTCYTISCQDGLPGFNESEPQHYRRVDLDAWAEGARERKQSSLETQDSSPMTENKREKIFGNLLTNSKYCAIIRMLKEPRNSRDTEW